MKSSNQIVGRVSSIDTYSTLDGFGIRSVVFMQGCDLRCIYCHNPETWCKTGGSDMTVNEIVNKLKNYISYYGSKGGVTFGGGEPLLQPQFISACVDKFSKLNVKCAIETSGNIKLSDEVKTLVAKLDFVICDLKFPNSELYNRYACVDIEKTLNFLDYLKQIGKRVWIRTVIVPDINDDEKMLNLYKKIIDKYTNVIRWELLPLSKLGFGKYEKLNIVNRLLNVKDLDMDKFKSLKEKFEFIK